MSDFNDPPPNNAVLRGSFQGRWSFDDYSIGWMDVGARTLRIGTRNIMNPGLPRRAWYEHAQQICALLNIKGVQP